MVFPAEMFRAGFWGEPGVARSCSGGRPTGQRGLQRVHFRADLPSSHLRESGADMPNSDFGPKLNLVLKAFSLSRGRLAAELKVDKSLVGRWVAGTVTPSAHNLSALTALVASRKTGFSLLDWDLTLQGLAERLGVEAVVEKQASGEAEIGLGFPARLIETARNETARRGHGFEGIWSAKRVAFTR